jgi:hypothetical protein
MAGSCAGETRAKPAKNYVGGTCDWPAVEPHAEPGVLRAQFMA